MSISHNKASQLLHADLDGTLSPEDRAKLEAHLSGCARCQGEKTAMSRLDTQLGTSLRGHWPRKSMTRDQLSQVARRVEAGSKPRWPAFSRGAGWLRGAAQFAAVAGVMGVMALMFGAIANNPFGSGDETGTPPAQTPETATAEGPCAVTATKQATVYAAPSFLADVLRILEPGETGLITSGYYDMDQVLWYEVSDGWLPANDALEIAGDCSQIPLRGELTSPAGDTATPTQAATSQTAEPTDEATPTVTSTQPTEPASTEALPTITTTPPTGAPAQPETQIIVGCATTAVNGTVSIPAPHIRVTVTLAADLGKQLAEIVVDVETDGSFSATLTYAPQPEGTHLIVAYGEWDGSKYLRPATFFGADCTGS